MIWWVLNYFLKNLQYTWLLHNKSDAEYVKPNKIGWMIMVFQQKMTCLGNSKEGNKYTVNSSYDGKHIDVRTYNGDKYLGPFGWQSIPLPVTYHRIYVAKKPI